MKLELGELPAFAFFPGQVVAVEGVNSSGTSLPYPPTHPPTSCICVHTPSTSSIHPTHPPTSSFPPPKQTGFKMVVRRVVEGIPRPFLTSPVEKLKEYHHDGLYQGGGALTLLVAAGPYTTTDSLEYEPFEDLLKVIAARQPDVAVLCGPFVDANHPKVAAGETEITGAGEEAESVDFESLFKMRVSFFLEGLYETNPTLATRIVLVPSLNDVFHDHVFPQPPLADRIPGGVPSPWFEEERVGDLGLPFASENDGADRRLHCLSNPSIFSMNEVAVGITTNDVLCHLSGDEVKLTHPPTHPFTYLPPIRRRGG